MIFFIVFGLGLLGTIILKPIVRRSLISIPIIYVLVGWLIASFVPGVPTLQPIGNTNHREIIEYLTEFAVIVSLLAAGLSIDRPFSIKPKGDGLGGWGQVWPLIAFTMPLTIIALTLLGHWWVGLGIGSALLVGAALSPTDPVLARSVQVGPPGEGERDDVRFNLTVEAGINDSLAFPFTYLAMAVAALHAKDSGTFSSTLTEWILIDVAWRIFAGLVAGVVLGRVTAAVVFSARLRNQKQAVHQSMGVIVFGMLFAAYGVAEIAEGYGFLAAFVGAVTVRQCEPDSDRHHRAHQFVDQVEQIVLVMLLLGLGAFVASGILSELTWPAAGLGVLAVLFLRPLFGWISLSGKLGHGVPWRGRLVVAFTGIRGLGTLYYVAYAMNHGTFEHAPLIWATCVFTILLSVFVHGVATPILVRNAEKHGAMAAC